MAATKERHGEYLIGNTKYFTIVAVEGTLERTLDKLLASSRQMDVGHAHMEDSPAREFLACWQYDPPADITMARMPDGNSSLFVLSQGQESTLKRAKELVEQIGLRVVQPSPGLDHSLDEMGVLEAASAMQAQRIAQLLKVSPVSAWSAVHYLTFLQDYRGVSRDDALRQACDRYGLDYERLAP